MKFSILLFLVLSLYSYGFSQEAGDKNIIINMKDSIDVYNKVKYALGKKDFIIRDDGNRDTITTHLRELRTMQGYCRIQVIRNGNIIAFSGIYGLKKLNDWGYTTAPKSYKPIIYFKGSKLWPLLIRIASEIDGEISYSK